MNPQQQTQYIIQQRQRGVSDDEILVSINNGGGGNQRGFKGELVPTAFSIGGGLLGGLAGAVGGPAGIVAGGIAGATAGGALGEGIQQGIEKKYGQRQQINPGQIVAQGAISGGTQAIGGIFAKLGSIGLRAARPTVVNWVSKLSGFDDAVISKALERTPGVVKGVREGEVALQGVVRGTAKGVQDLARKTLQESNLRIAELSKLSQQRGMPGTARELLRQSSNFAIRSNALLRNKYNIGVDKAGKLLFDRGNTMSNIVSGGDRSAIQSASDAMRSIQKNQTIEHIDSVLERLIVLRSKTPVGSPTGAETRAIINDLSDEVLNFVESVPATWGPAYKVYAQFLGENLPKRIMITEAKELFGGSANLSPKEATLIGRRLLRLYNTGDLPVREFADTIGKEVGQDITGTAAGTLLNTGKEVLKTAQVTTPRGIISKLIEALPRSAVRSYAETGKMTGELMNKALLKRTAQTLGISVKALLQEVVNLSTNKAIY